MMVRSQRPPRMRNGHMGHLIILVGIVLVAIALVLRGWFD